MTCLYYCRRLLLLGLLVGSPIGALQAQQLMLPPPRQQLAQPPGIDLVANRITEDAHGHLWLATNNGLAHFDGQRLEGFHDPRFPQGDEYSTAMATPDGRVWLRMATGGLAYYDPARRSILPLADTTRLMREFLHQQRIYALFVDRQGQLWLGLYGQGLLRINPLTLAVEHVYRQNRTVRFVDEGPDGRIWFTTDKGLYVFDPRTGQTQGFFNDPANPHSLGSNALLSVYARPNGEVLVSMIGEFDVLDPRTGHVKRFSLPRSPRTETLWTHDFKPDAAGNAYFSVARAVYRYTIGGQLERLEFARPAEQVISILVSRRGTLWVNAGLRLDEYDLNDLRPVAPMNILDVIVNGTRLAENQLPSENRWQRDRAGLASLTVQENDIVQVFFSPTVEKRTETFRVQLMGHDRQWQSFRDSLTHVSYQLLAGEYTFLLSRARPGGGWEPAATTMLIRVQPPFYKTGWFGALMLVLAGSGGWGLYRIVARRQKLQRELARQEGEARSLRQVDELKTRFFANVTHELRTPLTLLLNANEQLAHQPLDEQGHRQVATINRNADQLLRLITQLLDMAKLDGGKLDLYHSLGDPVAFVNRLARAFAELAATKKIQLSVQAGETGTDYFFDQEKLEAISHNLLSNALKFTPAGGAVRVRVEVDRANQLRLTVADSGPGIPPDALSRIFERFYQVDSSSTRAYGGTGIGLAFVRELTELMGGTVEVESVLGEGSTFTVTLPLKVAGVANKSEIAPATPATSASPATPAIAAAPASPATPDNAPVVLVVEDNTELRGYLVDQLSIAYQVLAAVDGRAGLEQALARIPDLIVSDVMMPHMDGFALTGALKTDVRTSHIPVILLTARSSHDSVLHGLDLGADAYVGKPFKMDELKLQIRNAIQTRRNWQATLAGLTNGSSAVPVLTDPVPDREKRFLTRLEQLIMLHLQDEQVSTDWLATQVNMSRSQLHRKLTALTGESTTRFIHAVRLRRADELLRAGGVNVAEVAYQVGYNSQSYFTKQFQEQFGYLPTALKV